MLLVFSVFHPAVPPCGPASHRPHALLPGFLPHAWLPAHCHTGQVERMDDPALRGMPLAVRQFNAGGFVAVSYEARAAGVK